MNIVMMTNTYKPMVGGLENSVETFSEKLRSLGHKVLVVTPEMKGAVKEKDVFRVPAIQNFNGTDFSVELPVSTKLSSVLTSFRPDIVHSHHPFLIGDTALRAAESLGLPLVFTHHTLYEQNTHYVPLDSRLMKRFVIKLSAGYANLCDTVIVPSESIAEILLKRGVKVPVEVVPTGINIDDFSGGNGEAFRGFFGIPKRAFLVGVASRIAQEKNIKFLALALATFLKREKNAYFVLVGDGPELPDVEKYFERQKLKDRVIAAGVLKGKQLADAYGAMDVFAFASHSETQGLVLVEAMAAGVPVVAVDAPGIREAVTDKENGRLIKADRAPEFAGALSWVSGLPAAHLKKMRQNAKNTARRFSIASSTDRLLKIYERAKSAKPRSYQIEKSLWRRTILMLRGEQKLLMNMTKTAGSALLSARGT